MKSAPALAQSQPVRATALSIVMPVMRHDRLPDTILDILAELYWQEPDEDPAVAALRA